MQEHRLPVIVADFTYIWTAEGWLYVAVIIDLFSRRVVGWSMKDKMTTQMVTDALMMAIWRRGRPKELLHHSPSRDIAVQCPAGQWIREANIHQNHSRG